MTAAGHATNDDAPPARMYLHGLTQSLAHALDNVSAPADDRLDVSSFHSLLRALF
jgi:hypothetical protein